MDAELIEDEAEFDGRIGLRTAWWEQMVKWLINTVGQVSLT